MSPAATCAWEIRFFTSKVGKWRRLAAQKQFAHKNTLQYRVKWALDGLGIGQIPAFWWCSSSGLIKTGATGTNVNDLSVLLLGG